MKIGFTASAFDLLHAGHIAMLHEAKQHCDLLVVGLHTDPSIDRATKHKPVQTTYERWIQLKGVLYVNDIIPYDTENDLFNLLTILKPDIRFLGEEYREKDAYTGSALDIPIHFTDRRHNYSSSELRNRVKIANEGDSNFIKPTAPYQL